MSTRVNLIRTSIVFVSIFMVTGGVFAFKSFLHNNRPIIAESCNVKMLGFGYCTFTNNGKSEGAVCGKIVLSKPSTGTARRYPDIFCSGQLKPKTTSVGIPVIIPDAASFCSGERSGGNYGTGYQLGNECTFSFLPDNESLGAMK